MSSFMVRGRTVATTAAVGVGVAALWNPSTAYRMTVFEVWLNANAAPAVSAGVVLHRISARGTSATTVTPNIANDISDQNAPISGALLGLAAFSVQPTLDGAGFVAWTIGAAAGSGIIMPFPRGIVVPAGTGLALMTTNAVAIPASDVSFLWDE